MKSKSQVPAPHSKKRTYSPPKLVVHGDLKAMTTAKGGRFSDGVGKPRTRSGGMGA
jgi:hypothetical protein